MASPLSTINLFDCIGDRIIRKVASWYSWLQVMRLKPDPNLQQTSILSNLQIIAIQNISPTGILSVTVPRPYLFALISSTYLRNAYLSLRIYAHESIVRA
jgi:hypothetical protein